MTMYTVCFTGHRPKQLFGYDSQNAYIPLRRQLTRTLIRLAQIYQANGGFRVITGGAQGVDQLAFWAAVQAERESGVPIINEVYVPFRGQEQRWSETGLFSQEQYRLMLEQADNVIYCDDFLQFPATNYTNTVKLLHERNHMMVNAADRVMAVIKPDFSTQDSGGTAECIRYAIAQNIPIEFIEVH